MNRVVIVGNLTRDPELRQIPSGTSVCEVGVAVNEKVKRGEEWVDYASFFDVTVWGKQGENLAKHLSKGSKVGIDGRLRQERWTTDSGDDRSRVKVIAEHVDWLSPKQNGDGPSAQEPPAPKQEDEIPF